MGCARSKEAKCEQCKRPYSFSIKGSSPFHRRSLHRRSNVSETHSRAHSQRLSDAHNAASPASTTFSATSVNFEDRDGRRSNYNNRVSNAMPEIVPQRRSITATKLPSGEAETINTWELMEGLEGNAAGNDFSFQVPDSRNKTRIIEEQRNETKPMWLQMAANDAVPNSRSLISDFDPDIISTFRKALEELSPNHALLLRSPGSGRIPSPGHNRLFSQDSVDRIPSPGHLRMFSKDGIDRTPSRGHNRLFSKESNDSKDLTNEIEGVKSTPCDTDNVVLYFTSLRGVRKTYEDCCNVRVILKGLGVKLDERDVAMHYGFREELRQVLGTEGLLGKLPRVFVKGIYIGGADEVRQMHEVGELQKVIKGCEMVDESDSGVCQTCGDITFVPCDMCCGSCKIYIEDMGEGDGEGGKEGCFERCPYCNENGIVRCPICCS